ncbi:MAG: aldo/keto reductase [Gammaproteobacteria bacterium]
MQKRRLGRSDLYLTPLGLGTWAIGGPWAYGWGPQDDAESVATIGRALDLGVAWIDTAPAYGLGHAETLVGQAIRGRRDEVVIAIKCGLVWDDPAEGRITNRLTAASIEKEADESLRRLGIEAIDLYQIHWPNPDADVEEAWEAMARLVERGKVRHAGVSNFSVGQLRRVQALRPVTSLQPPYSFLDRGVEAELLPYCAAHGIGVVAYGPLAFGLLTGKYTRARLADLPADDWRRRGARFQEPELSANLALVEGQAHRGGRGALARRPRHRLGAAALRDSLGHRRRAVSGADRRDGEGHRSGPVGRGPRGDRAVARRARGLVPRTAPGRGTLGLARGLLFLIAPLSDAWPNTSGCTRSG